MKEIWDLGTLQVFLSNTGITTGSPCLFSSSVCRSNTHRSAEMNRTETLVFSAVSVFVPSPVQSTPQRSVLPTRCRAPAVCRGSPHLHTWSTSSLSAAGSLESSWCWPDRHSRCSRSAGTTTHTHEHLHTHNNTLYWHAVSPVTLYFKSLKMYLTILLVIWHHIFLIYDFPGHFLCFLVTFNSYIHTAFKITDL